MFCLIDSSLLKNKELFVIGMNSKTWNVDICPHGQIAKHVLVLKSCGIYSQYSYYTIIRIIHFYLKPQCEQNDSGLVTVARGLCAILFV
jgi:hypothetical protein